MDSSTLHVTDALVNLTCGVTVAILWLQRRSETCFAFWSASFFVFGLALLLGHAAEVHPLLGAAYFGGLGLGIKLMLAGYRNFDGRDAGILHAIPFVLAPPGAFLGLWAAMPSTPWPEFAAFVLCCLLGARTIAYVLGAREAAGTYRRIAGITLAVQLTLTLILALAAGTFLDARSPEIAIPFADQICTIVLVTCLFGMSVERNNRWMEEMAYRDALTGALNRMGLHRRIPEASGPAGLLVMDLDHFKRVNDRYGHLGGDAVLREFARRVRDCLPDDALFARMGGEEFLVRLPGADHLALATLAQAVRLATKREPVDWSDDGPIAMTVSIGFAVLRADESFESGIARADAALYRAKVGGRDRIAA